jgi:hypothetical protein
MWVSFVTVETKEKSKQWMHTYNNNNKKSNQILSARNLMVAVFWDRK